MLISTKGRYALRIMIDLARCESLATVTEIAARQGISLKYAEQIMTPLKKAGFVRGARGKAGGYELARPADSVTAGDVLRLMEGSLAPVDCLAGQVNTCPRRGFCPTLSLWREVSDAVARVTDGYTIARLAKSGKD